MRAVTQNEGARVTPYAELARWMREEARSRREHIEAEMRAKIEVLRLETEREETESLRIGRADFEELGRRIRAEAIGRAERESAAIVLRVVGNGVDRIMRGCEEHLRRVTLSDVFPPILEHLLLEAVAMGVRLRRQDTGNDEIGSIRVAPADAPACREILSRRHIRAAVLESPLLWGGVELQGANTPDMIRNTLLSRLRKQEGELRRIATERLTSAVDEGSIE